MTPSRFFFSLLLIAAAMIGCVGASVPLPPMSGYHADPFFRPRLRSPMRQNMPSSMRRRVRSRRRQQRVRALRRGRLHAFVWAYADALTSCDESAIASFYDRAYTGFETNGEMYGKAGLVKSLVGFCKRYSGSQFEVLKFRRVSWNTVYAVMRMRYGGLKKAAGRSGRRQIVYSQSFTMKHRWGGRMGILYDLKGINNELITASLVPGRPSY